MKSETENAGETKRAGHAWRMAAAGIVCVVLVALFVLPGFVAAWISRAGRGGPIAYHGPPFMINGVAWWDLRLHADWHAYSTTWQDKGCDCVLFPSGWAMRHSKALRGFYGWEFRLAGGMELKLAADPDPQIHKAEDKDVLSADFADLRRLKSRRPGIAPILNLRNLRILLSFFMSGGE